MYYLFKIILLLLLIEAAIFARALLAHLLWFHIRRLAIDSHQAAFIQKTQGLVSEPLGLDGAARIQIGLQPAFRVRFVDRHKVCLQALQFPLHRHHVASELTMSASPNEIRTRRASFFFFIPFCTRIVARTRSRSVIRRCNYIIRQ